MLRIILAAAAMISSGAIASADGHGEGGHSAMAIEAGNPAPEIVAVTAAGQVVNLDGISGEKGAVLVFSRSLDWCPYCKAQALELETVKADLGAAGWTMNLITYDSPDLLAEFSTEKDLTYTFLSDTGSATIDAFGLRNEDVTEGSRFDGIPHPAIVYIKANGDIAGIQKEAGYKERPATAGIPEMVAQINQDGLSAE